MSIAPAYNYANLAVPGTIGNPGGISAGSTSLYLSTTPSGYPGSFPFKLVLEQGTSREEIVKVTSGNGTSGTPWVIVRAWDGTPAAAHAISTPVQHMITAEDETLARAHEAATTAGGTTTIPGSAAGTRVHGLPDSAWSTAAVAAIYESSLANSTTASVTISAIPGTYNHLLLVVQGKFTETTAQADDLSVTLNGSSSAVYSYVEQFVTNVSGSSTGALFSGANSGFALTAWPIMRLAASQSGSAANAGGGTAWIPNYTSATFNKCFQSQSGAGDGSSAFVDMRTRSGFFNPGSQAAVTSMTLTAPGGLFFTSGTYIGLFGMG